MASDGKVRKTRQPSYDVSRLPLTSATKVSLVLRKLYLDDLIKEYMNANHDEKDAISKAQKEERQLVERSANKFIYHNLVANLKKRIRDENANINNVKRKNPSDDIEFVGANRVVSHEDILTGKSNGSYSIEKKRKLPNPKDLNKEDLYNRLKRYIIPYNELEKQGYPIKDEKNCTQGEAKLSIFYKNHLKYQPRNTFLPQYTCERCSTLYRVGEDGMQQDTTRKCIYHPGRLWNERIDKTLEKRFSCCKGDAESGGCQSNPYHVHRGEYELVNYRGYVETRPKLESDPNTHGIFALDCEMCYTTNGLELSRITVINHEEDVIYERLVKPKQPILDYNTKFSGIKDGDLDNIETTLEDVQRDLLEIFSAQSILIGHSLNSDMTALKIFHNKFIDTAYLFPHKRGLPFKRALRTLMVENLKVIIQEDDGHDSKEDACAALRLVMWKAKTDVPLKT